MLPPPARVGGGGKQANRRSATTFFSDHTFVPHNGEHASIVNSGFIGGINIKHAACQAQPDAAAATKRTVRVETSSGKAYEIEERLRSKTQAQAE